jgi:hypothetical protein
MAVRPDPRAGTAYLSNAPFRQPRSTHLQPAAMHDVVSKRGAA